MRILVTGGLGFIGSNFILYLLSKYPNYKITNLDAMLEGSNIQNLNRVKSKPNYFFVKGNITDQRLVDKLISKNEIIINFAAESHVDRSILSPRSFINSNYLGVYTILESIRKYKRKFIQISTDEVFGSLKKGRADEEHRFNPSNPYAASKAAAESLVNAYITTYDCNVIITRCTNNFGPRQSPEKLVPKTIILAEMNKKIPIYGSGKNKRDWIFVEDHCNAILKILFKGKSGESYNISANNEIDNITLVKKILKIMDKSSNQIEKIIDRPGHDYRYSLNSSKISKKLNWKISYNFESALEHTIKWYLDNKKWWKKLIDKTSVLKWQ